MKTPIPRLHARRPARLAARFPTRFLAASLTALLVSGTVYAHDAAPKASSDATTIYEGLDAQGQIVRVTISKSTDAQPVAVSSHVPRYPELNWTAHIGSGTAATIAH
ncbi:MAG TPA: hypothetical protein VGC34_06400 [Steroidobacteraceae bacterium]